MIDHQPITQDSGSSIVSGGFKTRGDSEAVGLQTARPGEPSAPLVSIIVVLIQAAFLVVADSALPTSVWTTLLPLGTLPPPAQPLAPAFVFTPPEQAKQLFPVTMALVRPRFEDPARMLGNPRWAQYAAANRFCAMSPRDQTSVSLTRTKGHIITVTQTVR